MRKHRLLVSLQKKDAVNNILFKAIVLLIKDIACIM